MRLIPQQMRDTIDDGEFTGDRRPMARVTLQRLNVQLQKIDAERLFASALFGQADIPIELPNLKSVAWERSTGADVATCTIVFYNTAPLPLGEQPTAGGDFDLPGYYTFNYGVSDWSSTRWGQEPNQWQDYLVPDRILRTYEGYGFSPLPTPPETDPHLIQTGTWLIDDVEYNTDGLITVTCRDVGRLLLDHICFPPVIPRGFYPMEWEPHVQVDNPDTHVPVGGTFRPTYLNDSGYSGHYVGKNAFIHGHKPSHAFDTSDKTYWMSIGNQLPKAGYSFEWIEGGCGGRTLSTVTFKVWGGPYRVYLSVKIKGKWSGKATIPYDPKHPISAPNGADIPYSMVATVKREGSHTFKLAHPVANVEAIRLTFTGLYNSGIGPFKYRAGVRSIVCAGQSTKSNDGGTTTTGNFGDYTDIVKYLLACGGFHWPKTNVAFLTYSDGTKVPLPPTKNDPFLKSGRVWGDLELSGTTSYVDTVTQKAPPLQSSIFDKKPLMDGIAYVRDILGFLFYIDEQGGAVFRLPNIFSLGNFVGNLAANAGYFSSPSGSRPDYTVQAGDNWITVAQQLGVTEAQLLAANAARGGHALAIGEQIHVPGLGHDPIPVIDERKVITGLRAKISSKNIREHVFVADSSGNFGATAAGYNPIKPNPGLRRVGGWTDQNFKDAREAQKMADMITVAQAFTYRTDSITMVADPSIQIDDQVRIYERISGEGFYHYVKGIKSELDLEEGKWTYTLDTNWLGEDPFERWAFDPAKLTEATREYILAIQNQRS